MKFITLTVPGSGSRSGISKDPKPLEPRDFRSACHCGQWFASRFLLQLSVPPSKGISVDAKTLTQAPITVTVEDVSHQFSSTGGGLVQAVEKADFIVRKGEFISLVGPSGCGKTTILNMMAGLVQPTTGRVTVLGAECDSTNRKVGYMFARDGLMPWRTALKNVEFGLELRGVNRKDRHERAAELLRLVGLDAFTNSYPRQLSQGMRQRVALARTLAIEPEVILLDEPFAALDAQTRVMLHAEFIRIWESTGKTVVLVTHDVTEAVSLSDRIIVMSPRPGRVAAEIEVDLPRPRDLAALRFDPRFHELTEEVWRYFSIDL